MDTICKHCGSVMDVDELGRYGGGFLCPICDTFGSISMFLHEQGHCGIITPSLFIDINRRTSCSECRLTMTDRALF